MAMSPRSVRALCEFLLCASLVADISGAPLPDSVPESGRLLPITCVGTIGEPHDGHLAAYQQVRPASTERHHAANLFVTNSGRKSGSYFNDPYPKNLAYSEWKVGTNNAPQSNDTNRRKEGDGTSASGQEYAKVTDERRPQQDKAKVNKVPHYGRNFKMDHLRGKCSGKSRCSSNMKMTMCKFECDTVKTNRHRAKGGPAASHDDESMKAGKVQNVQPSGQPEAKMVMEDEDVPVPVVVAPHKQQHRNRQHQQLQQQQQEQEQHQHSVRRPSAEHMGFNAVAQKSRFWNKDVLIGGNSRENWLKEMADINDMRSKMQSSRKGHSGPLAGCSYRSGPYHEHGRIPE